MNEACRYIENFLHREVPLSKHIGMQAKAYDGGSLELHANLEPNINVHGTAFGGSIYSMCAFAGWGLLTLKLRELGLAPRIMIAQGRIDYAAPVTDTIRARAQLNNGDEFERFVAEHRERVRARMDVPVTILGNTDDPAARFTGNYITVTAG